MEFEHLQERRHSFRGIPERFFATQPLFEPLFGEFFAAFFPPMVAQPAQKVSNHAGKGSAGGVTAVVADAWPGPQ